MNQDKLIVVRDGKEIPCDILFSLVCNETKKGYVAYTDDTTDENGKKTMLIGVYDPSVGTQSLSKLEDPREWELINSIIDKLKTLK